MAGTGQTGFGFPKEYGGGEDIGASVAAFETLAFGDLSVVVKVGVQFGLFGGAILQLGTKPHHDAYLDDLIHGRLLGCFAMTETGHGSNVQALGTTATYDAETREFVIDTPDDRARKDYIGNAAAHASHAVVFAQLVRRRRAPTACTRSSYRIRDDEGKPLPGVRIEDDGPKIGLNGVDNGRIWFDGVRVPRDRPAQPLRRWSPRTAATSPTSRTRTAASSPCSARSCRAGCASAARRSTPPRWRWRSRSSTPTTAGSSAPRAPTRRRCCSTTACTSGGCSRCWPGPTRCTSPRSGSPPTCTRCSPTSRTRGPRARPPGAGVTGRRHQGAGHLARRRAPSRSAARPAAARATCRSTGSTRCGPTPTCSPPSRATTRSCCSWSPRACSPTTRTPSRTSTRSAWSGSWRPRRSRPCSSAPTPARSWSGCATCVPVGGRTSARTRTRACSTAPTSWRC